jgi:hypothetical protein
MTEFKIEHDIQNDEVRKISLTDKESKEFEKMHSDSLKNQVKADAAKAKAEADKAALLARLGLTEDELKIILG